MSLKKIGSLFLFVGIFMFDSLGQNPENWNLDHSPIYYVKNYANTSDTTHLLSALDHVNSSYLSYSTEFNEETILQIRKKIDKLPTTYRANGYSLIRQYYQNIRQQNLYFEYTFREYRALTQLGDSEELMWILVNLGNIFFYELDFNKATEFYKKAEKIALKKKDDEYKHAYSVVIWNYGLIAERQKHPEKALSYYRQSSAIRMQGKNPKFAAFTIMKEADMFIDLNQLDSAKFYLDKAWFCFENLGEPSDQLVEFPIQFKQVSAEYEFKMGNVDQGFRLLNQAATEGRAKKIWLDVVTSDFLKLEKLVEYGRYNEAIPFGLNQLEMENIASSLDYTQFVYQQLAVAYYQIGNYKLSADSYRIHLEKLKLKRENDRTDKLDALKTIAAIFESETKLEEANKNLLLAEIKNKSQVFERNISLIFVSVFGAAVIIMFVLFFNIRRTKKKLSLLNTALSNSHSKLNENSKQLEHSNKIKDKLFSIIAHDLRNPLNRLTVETAILKRSIEDKTLVEPVENTLKETINLFERLLQWSKMENKAHIYIPTDIDLNDNLNKVIAFYLPEIESRKIEIENNNPTYFVFVDPNFLQTLFRNILSNSIAAVNKGGRIKIETQLRDPQYVHLIFSDSGSGFPANVVQFFNNPDANLNDISSGLGLVLCKELAKISGWEIRIMNKMNESGAEITLKLPLFEKSNQPIILHEKIEIPDSWKEKLIPIKTFKFYQVSQIRGFLKTIETPLDKDVKQWKDLIELSIHEGNELLYQRLLEKLD